jgi:hypothetical protein
MPLELIEEIGAGAADAIEERIGDKRWWKMLKLVLLYGPVVFIGTYIIGYSLDYF